MVIFTNRAAEYLKRSEPTVVLIALNLLFFIVIRLSAASGFGKALVEEIGLSQSAEILLSRPWTPLTYMFTHIDFAHLLFNMVWLGFSAVVLSHRFRHRAVYLIYVLSGLAGACGFIAIAGSGQFMIGASCAGSGLLAAMASSLRRVSLELPLAGEVNAGAVMFLFIVLHLVYIFSGSVTVGAAHLSGIIAGIVCAIFLPRLSDSHDHESDIAIDEIRKKIMTSGYASLTADEKNLIRNHSSRQS